MASTWKVKVGELCYCQQRTSTGLLCMAEMPCRWHDLDWRTQRVGNHGVSMLKRRMKRDAAMREQMRLVVEAIESMG